jgi:hypothetical protein
MHAANLLDLLPGQRLRPLPAAAFAEELLGDVRAFLEVVTVTWLR